MRIVSRISLVIAIFACCIGCDQVSKMAVRIYIVQGETFSYLHDTFRLTHAENAGAFLSLGDALPEQVRHLLFTVSVAIISIVALVAAFCIRRADNLLVTGLTLIAAGGFGNWIDRVTNSGHVTDFMNVGIGWLRTGIFNIADVALMVGLTLCFLASKDKETGSQSSLQR